MSTIRTVIAVVLFLVGAVWIGQGIGVIGGSAMSGSTFWAIVGAVLVTVAAAIVVTGRRTNSSIAPDDRA
ncbi:MAG TPA: hypothetical protein VFI28_05000 [Candidatus Limnocylindrales bacterium]|nr:hypothetical protein [Candidatus Limnocylindrales bacterium]